MRIISGSARGKRLATFDGNCIRPTSDRLREALFSILFSRLGDLGALRVLDLYAGTGALSLEALSRGAFHATLVDENRQAVAVIEQNARACGVQDRIRLLQGRVLDRLPQLQGQEPYGLIFVDPPYGRELVLPTLEAIVSLELLAKNGLICVETSRKEAPTEPMEPLQRLTERCYGSSRITLLAFQNNEDTCP